MDNDLPSLGLYDSDTGESLKTEKVADITDTCPEGDDENRVVLLFARAKRGRIVQILRPYKGEKYMGISTHFFVDEISTYKGDLEEAFAGLARRLGLSKVGLTELITKHAPA